MTVYECPTKECKSTDIAAKLFEERAKAEAARAAALAKARAEWEAKDKARKAEFAEKWFKKIPVVKASERRESFLSLPPGDAAAAAAASATASSSTEVAQIQVNYHAEGLGSSAMFEVDVLTWYCSPRRTLCRSRACPINGVAKKP